jgi:hypothetical protein
MWTHDDEVKGGHLKFHMGAVITVLRHSKRGREISYGGGNYRTSAPKVLMITDFLIIFILQKMKSMQPKDFDEELKNSAQQAKRTLKRRENQMKKLAWRNLFTEDSQPDEEQVCPVFTC